jgi:transposase
MQTAAVPFRGEQTDTFSGPSQALPAALVTQKNFSGGNKTQLEQTISLLDLCTVYSMQSLRWIRKAARDLYGINLSPASAPGWALADGWGFFREFLPRFGPVAFRRTVYRLRRSIQVAKRAVPKPALTFTHMMWRVLLAQQMLTTWILTKIWFSDEKTFVFSSRDSRPFVWLSAGETHIGRKRTYKTAGWRVTFWGAISLEWGATALFQCPKATMKGSQFLQLMKDVMPHLKRKQAGETEVLFLEDNAPCHVKVEAQVRALAVAEGLVWKPQSHVGASPDMNPIEFVWGLMVIHLNTMAAPTSRDDFIRQIQAAWVFATSTRSVALMLERLRRNCGKIIAQDGGNRYHER